MTSKLELVLLALVDVLETTGAAIERNTVLPTRIPAAGLIILRDGDPGQPDHTMSPMTWHFEHVAEVEIFVQPAASQRDADFDTIKVAIELRSQQIEPWAACVIGQRLCRPGAGSGNRRSNFQGRNHPDHPALRDNRSAVLTNLQQHSGS